MRSVYTVLLEVNLRSHSRGRPILTADGTAYIERLLRDIENGSQESEWNALDGNETEATDLRPFWDADQRQLVFHGKVVLEYARSAPLQAPILETFQQSDWLKRINNPLVHLATERRQNPSHCLRDAVKNLNRRLAHGTIRFRFDRTAQQVIWYSVLTRRSRGIHGD